MEVRIWPSIWPWDGFHEIRVETDEGYAMSRLTPHYDPDEYESAVKAMLDTIRENASDALWEPYVDRC